MLSTLVLYTLLFDYCCNSFLTAAILLCGTLNKVKISPLGATLIHFRAENWAP